MPNWCENETVITGPQEVLESIMFICKVNATEPDLANNTTGHFFSMNALYPIPENEDWYDWCVNNWGTKWDVNSPQVYVTYDGDASMIELNYDTAWSPPIEFFEYLTKKFPKINVHTKYFEPGMNFIGERYFEDGKSKGIHKQINSAMWRKLGFKVYRGNVDWDSQDDFSIWDLFPLKKGK